MRTKPTAAKSCLFSFALCVGRFSFGAFRRGAALVLLLAVFAPLPSRAQQQTVPRLQLFGGYSYLRFNSQTFGFANASGLNGWNVAASGNLFYNFGVVAELSGQYGAHFNLRDLAIGPQFLFPHGKYIFFGHALFGKARTLVRQGTGAEDTQRAYEFGGGIDRKFLSRFDIRIIQADYLHTSLLQQSQNNIRLSTGIVFHWGTIREKGHRPPKLVP